ncbi:hypothetical protein ACFU9B_17360 [Streptomyces sp. NPDC057592]|uniref:hypothetical protein n=1 Tax=unclassified Streptomyces TaxID=2593676 RepID=UPI0036A971D1
MSTSDQDQAVETPIPGPEADPETGPGADPEAGAETGPEAVAKAEPAAETEPAADEGPGADEEAVPDEGTGADEEAGGRKLTPRQARRLRMVLSSVGMAAMAVVLALRIASRSSVLVVGVYGLALILCGIVIELSRNGRTRLGSWLLAVGLVAAIGSDWLLIP